MDKILFLFILLAMTITGYYIGGGYVKWLIFQELPQIRQRGSLWSILFMFICLSGFILSIVIAVRLAAITQNRSYAGYFVLLLLGGLWTRTIVYFVNHKKWFGFYPFTYRQNERLAEKYEKLGIDKIMSIYKQANDTNLKISLLLGLQNKSYFESQSLIQKALQDKSWWVRVAAHLINSNFKNQNRNSDTTI